MKEAGSEPLECAAPDMSPETLRRLREELDRREGFFRSLAEQHALLASDSRLRILSLLRCVGELCVCDLATILRMTPAAVSQHLSRLRGGGLVRSRRDGMTIHYSLTRDTWVPVDPPPLLESSGDAPPGP